MKKLGLILGALLIAAVLVLPVSADNMYVRADNIAPTFSFAITNTSTVYNMGTLAVGANVKTTPWVVSVSSNTGFRIRAKDTLADGKGAATAGKLTEMVSAVYNTNCLGTAMKMGTNGFPTVTLSAADVTIRESTVGATETNPLTIEQTVLISDKVITGGVGDVYNMQVAVTGAAI